MDDHVIAVLEWAMGGMGVLQMFTLGLIVKHMFDCSQKTHWVDLSHHLENISTKVTDIATEVGGPNDGLRGDMKLVRDELADLSGYARRQREEIEERRLAGGR